MSLTLAALLPTVQLRLRSMSITCAYHDCPTKQFVRIIPGHREGIRVGELWYCSAACFQQASHSVLLELCTRRIEGFARDPRLSIGLVLLSKGYLTSEQLRTASAESRQFHEDLERTVLRLGLITERQLAAARSSQWGYPVLSERYAGQLAELNLPRSLMSAFCAVPLEHSSSARRILLGFGSRIYHGLLESIEHMTGCRTVPCFVTRSEVQTFMERAVNPAEYREIVMDETRTVDRMAATLGGLAARLAAKTAKFTRCKDFIWVRLSGEHSDHDIVFTQPDACSGLELEENEDVLQSVVNWG